MSLLLLLLACASPEPAPAPALAPPPAPPPAPPVVEDARRPIEIEEPRPGLLLEAGPFEVRGSAQVWEGRLSVRLVDAAGATLDTQHVSASVAAPGRGAWSATLTAPEGFAGPAVVEAFSTSAKDGSPENVLRQPVVIR